MAKRRRRKAFAVPEKAAPEPRPEKMIDTTGGVFGFFRDHGVRETIESIIVAVILALLFRAYEAEAFIIPTGSMAPSLQGQHMDVVCDECGYQYRAGASKDASNVAPEQRARVTKTYCPICRYPLTMQQRNPDHHSNNGDRILVNKFVYDFKDPQRFDVIVFKNPNNGKQNYIKRLVGLPGDRLLIHNGDVYNVKASGSGSDEREILRKPADRIDAMLQLVDDTHHISRQLKSIDWPSRWRQWADPNADWKENESGGHPFFDIEAADGQPSWLRYRHLAPRSPYDDLMMSRNLRGSRKTEWEQIEESTRPQRIESEDGKVAAGTLIRDHYEYNDRVYRLRNQGRGMQGPEFTAAAHWVGDLAMECELVVRSDSGTLALDLVEGGVHFTCEIDIATGQATISVSGDDGDIVFDTPDQSAPTAKTSLQGNGSYKVRYAQLDDMVYLWINDRHVEFNGASYTRKSNRRPIPRYSAEGDPGDAEPLGIGAADGASVRVNRLKVLRDIYYVAPVAFDQRQQRFNIDNETGTDLDELVLTYENPQLWSSPKAKEIFDRDPETGPVFELGDGQYFPMGDNSPASQDARIWGDQHYVDEDYLIGRAMFIYWPHSLNRPIKFFPNFGRMGFIR